MSKKTSLTTVTMSAETFDGAISVQSINETDGTWQCKFEKKVDEATNMVVHEGLVIASNVVDATTIYRSQIPAHLRGAFDAKQMSEVVNDDCKHCNAPIGECDGNCDALPNELDDESENMG